MTSKTDSGITLTADQKALMRRLRKERATLKNPVDRIVFDNRRVEGLPNLSVGLWLLAFSEERE